jgi:hypothetical protein
MKNLLIVGMLLVQVSAMAGFDDNDDLRVEQILKSSNCLSDEKFQIIQNLMVDSQSLSNSEYVLFAGANLTRCLEIKFGKLEKENRYDNSANVVRETGIAILKAKNTLDVAHYLNSVIKFPFEKTSEN